MLRSPFLEKFKLKHPIRNDMRAAKSVIFKGCSSTGESM